MKPIFDISNKNSFTVWESCVWRNDLSSSVIVGDFETNKLQVIYDKDPTRTSTHALFYANIGNILAGCFIKKPSGRGRPQSLVRVELLRIESLTTKPVQGNTVPDAQLEPLHLTSTYHVVDFESDPDQRDLDKLIGRYEERPSLPNARSMMEEAIKKAMTPPAKQRLFWGVPRVKVEQD